MSNLSQINNSLIGFLQKKSLFANSPEKGSKRRQKSVEGKELKIYTPRQIHRTHDHIDQYEEQSPRKVPILVEKRSETRFKPNTVNNREEADFTPLDSPIRYPNHKTNFAERQINRNLVKNTQQNASDRNKKYNTQQQVPSKQIWAGLTNHSNAFESARIESSQCLQSLSVKLQNEISSINYKLDMFNSKMNTMINNELKKLREKIYEVVERAFQESQRNIRQFMKIQQDNFAGDLIRMREHLEQEYQKVEIMKEELKKPGWRKVAGQLLSSELETTIQDDVKRSSNLNIAHWEIGDLGAHKIKGLEDHLKDMVKISR